MLFCILILSPMDTFWPKIAISLLTNIFLFNISFSIDLLDPKSFPERYLCSLIFWLLVLSFGESNYELFLLMINSFIGKFILIGFTWSMSFHLLSGIRHLVLDFGYGFEIKTANISGIIVIISSLVLTVLFWLLGRGLI